MGSSVEGECGLLAKIEDRKMHLRATGLLGELRPLLGLRWLQLLTLSGLLAGVGVISFNLKFCVLDLDIWWHLRVGDWIVQHLALPHSGILSRTAANRPWVAYSWGYEVLLSRSYAWFGLLGVGWFGTLLTLSVAFFTYWMLRRLSGRFWLAAVLSAFVWSTFLFNGMPRPVFFSIILFSITLTLLLEANRSGRVQLLYWLPVIFLFWANLHIQFIYGLFLVGLLTGVNLAQRVAASMGLRPSILLPPKLPAAQLVLVFVACVVATLAGPNFYHPYQVVLGYSKAKFIYTIIVELQPLTFAGYSHYAELLLTAAGFFAVGFQRKLDPFKLLLLMVGSVVAYRTMRDAWFICLPAAACIADFPAEQGQSDRPESWAEKAIIGAIVAVFLLVFARGTSFDQRGLDRAISGQFPVNAVNFLRSNPLPGPLYNNFNWGGFLTWYMPQYPVVVDGRTDLYGDELDKLFAGTENADNSYKTNPYLNEAGVVLLDSGLPLAKVLTIDPRFTQVYQDSVATVFAHR
jgi:hypothetical protein